MKHRHTPPRWAQKLLAWYCKPSLLEDLQGDLHEYFQRNVAAKGLRRAQLIYIVDVLKFIRLYTLRKPAIPNPLIHWIMIASYIKTSARNIARHALFSTINIVGLAISMSVGLLVIAFVADLKSYDTFHAKHDRIYRVVTTDAIIDRAPMKLATTSVAVGQKIRETIAGIESSTLVGRGFGGDAKVGDATVGVGGLWADAGFFNVFDFPMLQGNPATALKEPYSLVVTQEAATRLFGHDDALGKTVKIDTTTYTVTGVLANVPKNSHLRFEVLASHATQLLAGNNSDGNLYDWTNIYLTYLYVVLPEDASAQSVGERLANLSAAENANLQRRHIDLSLQPLREIAVGPHYENQAGPTIHYIAVWVLAFLAGVVILSACFNYTNLSIARAMRRAREVGIRKVMGAHKAQVRMQFIAESVMIALLALLFSFALFMLLRPQFLGLNPFFADLVSMELSWKVIAGFVAMALVVGTVAGFLPAFFFARINPVTVLKDVTTLRMFRRVTLRKALIVVQYAFSLVFIGSTLIGYDQYKTFLTFDLGYNTHNIVNIKLQGNNAALLRQSLAEIPAVEGISVSRLVTSLGSMQGQLAKYKDPNDSVGVWINFVDENYLPLHEHRLLAGGNLSRPSPGASEREVVVNESLLKHFNLHPDNPAKAIGEVLQFGADKLTIAGVVRDFHYGTLESSIGPTAFRYSANEPGGSLNVKVNTTDWAATRATIEEAWRKLDRVHPLDASFYDEQIEQAYSQFSVMVKVIGFLAFLAVSIASMGLFGMVVFTTETRLKEISIRKVLGAAEGSLMYMLGRSFIVLLAVAAFIAGPITYLLFDKVVLVNFVYHKPLGFGQVIASVAAVMLVALGMIVAQTLKVARTNPAEILKNE